MANLTQNIARNDLGRAWIFEDGVLKCGARPTYVPCLSVDSLTQDRGDITRVECPDPFRYGQFIEVGSVPGEISRLTTTFTGRMTRDELSFFRGLFNKGCSFDVQIHFGLCANPTNFNQFDKVLVFNDVQVTSFSTDPLVALQSGDRAEITETIDVSIGDYFELVQLQYIEQGNTQTAATAALIDAIVVDAQSCGEECDASSDGCQNLFTIDDDGVVLYTTDSGITWATAAQTLDGTGLQTVTGLDELNGFMWAYNQNGEIVYTTDTDIRAGVAPQVVTGLNATGVDQDSGFSYGLVVGPAGFVGYTTSPDAGFTLLPTPVTAANLSVVSIGKFGAAADFTLIGGATGVLIASEDGQSLELVTTTPASLAAATITAVLARTKSNWVIGADNGEVWCTEDAGVTWTQVSIPTVATAINAIEACNSHEIFVATNANFLRSVDGGVSYLDQPSSKKSFPTNGGLNAIVCCPTDPNRVWAVGDDGTAAGIIVDGSPA